ncbi:MAG TPA: SDR family oxidoreductase [Telmatospirillum sp.]|nr:SDR family oxidoreductase [Telmatospirillum sp.]
MGSLVGKRALVTGAEQGIGKAVAEGLLKAGCDIAIHYFMGEEGPKELVALATSVGRKAHAFQADLTDEAAAVKMVGSAAAFLGGLDILINNVGGLVERRFLEQVDPPFWKKVNDINLITMMMVTREAVPHLVKAKGASIVNLASLAGRKGGHAGSLVYSMTKGAVLTFTRALSSDLGAWGIRVNAVAPGLILGTRFHNTHTSKESAEETIKGIPLGRAGDIYDIARPIVFLASEYDGFISGATIDINGGIYCA